MAVQSLYQSKREQFVDANGKPIVSGKLYIGTANTDPTVGGNQIPVYPSRADAIAGTNALSQPLLTDSFGRTDESVWVTTSYAYVLTDSADVQLLTEPYIEVVDIAQEIQDAIDAAFATLEQAYVNLFVNGSMVIGSGTPVTLTGSFLEGEVTRTYGRALNVSAGTMEQGTDDEFGTTGWNASFLGVSCPNTSDYVEFQIRIASQDAIRMANRAAMFSALVDHDVGASIDYTITFAVADALDDFSSVTVVETSGDLTVANEAATRIEFTTADMGDCSNGVAITIRAKAGQITTKNFRFTEVQPEVGAVRTVFQTLGYDVVYAAINAAALVAFKEANADISEIAYGEQIDYQVFTSNGTWTKPACDPDDTVIAEIWSGGGSGSICVNSGGVAARGGAGGGYWKSYFRASDLDATESVVVGAGGTAVSGSTNTVGVAGGQSSFKGVIVSGGGAGNVSSVANDFSTPGARVEAIGSSIMRRNQIGTGGWAVSLSLDTGDAGNIYGSVVYGGGAGQTIDAAGSSVSINASKSIFGGDGGASASGDSVTASSGSVPGGGGGSVRRTGGTCTSGAGARGEVRITVIKGWHPDGFSRG